MIFGAVSRILMYDDGGTRHRTGREKGRGGAVCMELALRNTVSSWMRDAQRANKTCRKCGLKIGRASKGPVREGVIDVIFVQVARAGSRSCLSRSEVEGTLSRIR